MMLIDDVGVLTQLLRGQRSDGSHAENLQSFYAPQAAHYDRFRERLLAGRGTLIDLLDVWPGDRVVELGGGTGRNLDYFGQALLRLESYELVDLCPALLDVARKRAGLPVILDAPTDSGRGASERDMHGRRPVTLRNLRITEADAQTWQPALPVDVVLMSYSLTMMPDWEKALVNALAMLKPGGKLALVDFHIPSRASRIEGWFWRRWFSHDGVRLSRDHLAWLRQKTEPMLDLERRAPVPYLSTLVPGLKVPYYLYIGRKP